MRQVAAGDQQAFETLYHRYARRVTGYLTPLLWYPELVEEVRNDVMLALWQHAARFDPERRLSTWLLGLARHKAVSALRRTPPEPAKAQPPESADTVEPSLEESLTRHERQQQVAGALHTLPPAQRAVVEYVYYQERSYQEIATLLACPVNTVKTRMLQARRRLAPTLVGLGVGPVHRLREERRRGRRSRTRHPATAGAR
jgi:RNA polymerase sigma-70 factor (ECF subfamily)